MIKNIGLRIVGIALIFLAANWIYKTYFFEDFLQDHGTLLYYQQNALDADYLYYSASSEFSYDPENDTNQERITKLIGNHTDIPVKHVAEAAHHAGIFAPCVQQLNEGDVKGIVVVLNYRSFSPEWLESNNENSLLQSRTLYENRPVLINRLFMSLNAYEQHSNEEREKRFLEMFNSWPLPLDPPKNTIASWCAVEKYGDWTNPKRQLADHFIKNYGFVLHDQSPRMSDFDLIAQYAKERKLSLLYVLIPENIELAKELLGNDIIQIMNQNRKFLMDRYDRPNDNQYVLDLMDLLKDENFIDRKYPTEHYNFEGRNQVAQQVAGYLEKIESQEK